MSSPSFQRTTTTKSLLCYRDLKLTDEVNKINERLLNMAGYGSSAAGESIPVHDLTDSEADDDDVVVIE